MTTDSIPRTASDDGRERDPEAEWIRALVQQARRGDREAFGDLYRRYGRLVHGVLLARLPAGQVALQGGCLSV